MAIAGLAATVAVVGAVAVAMRLVMHSEPVAATSHASSGTLTPRAPSAMVWIPGGEFTMGTSSAMSMRNERPAHRV